jgi:hypothetical protein
MAMIIRLLIFVVLFEFLPGGIESHGKPNALPQICHCATDTTIVQVWQTRYGAPDQFAASAVNRWNQNTLTSQVFPKTEQLIILGKSPKGVWSIASTCDDGEPSIQANLVCTNVKGKRKVFPLIPELPYMDNSSLRGIVLRKLRLLAKTGDWDVASMTPVTLLLRSKHPMPVFREKGKQDDEGYTWSLYIKNRENRFIQIKRQLPGFVADFFNAAKCFGGVIDNGGAEIWWVLIKTHSAEWCFSEWRSIRLPR